MSKTHDHRFLREEQPLNLYPVVLVPINVSPGHLLQMAWSILYHLAFQFNALFRNEHFLEMLCFLVFSLKI